MSKTGSHILHYRIEERLGEGGMGVVYKAQDTRLKRSVALKFLPHSVATRPDERVELDREAQLAASLNHPNIATIYSLEESDGEVFIAMEYIPGRTLDSMLSDDGAGAIPMDQKLEIAIGIAAGVVAAHQRGILHGDIKCGNIMMTPDGVVKILDFGVARSLSASRTGRGAAGTLAYMSPEQARGEPYDQQSDIWALGVVLYRLFSGVHPFRHTYEQAILYSIMHEKPPGVRTHDDSVPEAVEEIISRCMEKSPAARCTSAGEVLKSLEEIRKALVTAAAAEPRTAPFSPKLRWSLALGAAAVALIAGALYLFRSGPMSDDAGASAIAILPLQNLGPERSDGYLGDGITEALITDLSKYPELSVTARRSVMRYRDEERNLQEIARAIGVRYILDGSVQKSGTRIRVSVQLVDASTGEDLWAERYDREVVDLFALQDDISGRVASTLTRGVLSGSAGKKAPLTTNMAAYDFYLRGMSYAAQLDRVFQGSTGPSDEIAIGMFEQAVALDPRFAAARAALASSYLTKMFSRDPSPVWGEKAERQIDTALSLNPNLAEAHLARASLVWNRQRGFPHAEAIAELRKATTLQPSLADAHALLGSIYLHVGLHDEAEKESRKALQLDPNNTFTRNRIPGISLYRQEYPAVLEEFAKNPGLGGEMKWMAVLAMRHLGMKDQARDLCDSLLRRYPENEDLAVTNAVLLAAEGDRAGAEQEIARAISLGEKKSHFHHVQFNIACAYALMGDTKRSVQWLTQAAAEGLPSYPLFADHEFLRSLQGNEPYQKLLERLKEEMNGYRHALREAG